MSNTDNREIKNFIKSVNSMSKGGGSYKGFYALLAIIAFAGLFIYVIAKYTIKGITYLMRKYKERKDTIKLKRKDLGILSRYIEVNDNKLFYELVKEDIDIHGDSNLTLNFICYNNITGKYDNVNYLVDKAFGLRTSDKRGKSKGCIVIKAHQLMIVRDKLAKALDMNNLSVLNVEYLKTCR